MPESIARSWSEMKGDIMLGMSAMMSANPTVSASDMPMAFFCLESSSGSSTMRFKARIANKGIVNSAMTNMLATVRNLAYIGT